MRTVHIRTYQRRALLLLAFLVTLLFLFMVLSSEPAPPSTNASGGWLAFRSIDSNSNNDYAAAEEDTWEGALKLIKIGQDSAQKNTAKEKRVRADLGACKIPRLEVTRPEMMKFYKHYAPLDCASGRQSPDWLRVDDDRRVRATAYAKKHLGVKRIKCTWQFFERINDAKVRWLEERPFRLGDRVEQGDFFKARCTAADRKWENLFMTVVRNETRLKELEPLKPPPSDTSLNVYILGFDSLSQMSFRRNLPKSVEYLEKTMGSLVINGFNIVGDGTPQAFIPFLTGQTEEELPLTRKRYPQASFVDDVYPFAWANFSQRGYVTAYGEDSFAVGTFSYRLKGFRRQPTDHAVQTFFGVAEKQKECCTCIGAEPMHEAWFRYARSFWREYEGQPRFLLMHHSALSHDDVNRVQVADDALQAHLKEQFESGAFENAMVIVMADHGHRFAALRATHQGQLEERMPFFSVYLPPGLRDQPKYARAYQNLKTNSVDRLVSHFDIHPTLLDILNWPAAEKLEEAHDPAKEGRSLSLFREIPLSRTCDQAGIEAHWCTCLSWQPAMEDPDAFAQSQLMAKAVIQVINEETRPERKLCAKLKLSKILSSKRLLPNEELLKYGGVLDADGFKPKFNNNATATLITYQVVFETQPGGAHYEATLTHSLGKSITVDLMAISHINAYGDKPHCVIDKNFFLATYCVCYDRI